MKLWMGLIIGLILGIAIHVFYAGSCKEKVDVVEPAVLTTIDEGPSVDMFQTYMQAQFSDIDSVQEIRNETRVTRVEFTQETLIQLNDINKNLGSKLPLRLYFGMDLAGAVHFMAMSYDDSKNPANQTDRIYLIDGATPICPEICDNEGPYEM